MSGGGGGGKQVKMKIVKKQFPEKYAVISISILRNWCEEVRIESEQIDSTSPFNSDEFGWLSSPEQH